MIIERETQQGWRRKVKINKLFTIIIALSDSGYFSYSILPYGASETFVEPFFKSYYNSKRNMSDQEVFDFAEKQGIKKLKRYVYKIIESW